MKMPDRKPVHPAVVGFFLLGGCFLVMAAVFETRRRDSAEAALAGVLADHPRVAPTEQNLQELRNYAAAQEDRVEEARKILTDIIRKEDVIHSSRDVQARGRLGARPYTVYSPGLSYEKLSREKISLHFEIERLLRTRNQPPVPYQGGGVRCGNSPTILHPYYLEEKRRLESLKLSGLGDAHPSVVKQKEIVDDMRRDLDERGEFDREIVQVQLELVKEKLERLAHQRDGVVSVEWTESMKAYEAARLQLEASQDLLLRIRIRLISDEMEFRIFQDEETER